MRWEVPLAADFAALCWTSCMERRDEPASARLPLFAPGLLCPQWSLPPGYRAVVSTREGGASLPPWASFNLGSHVGDDARGGGSTAHACVRRSAPSRCGSSRCMAARWRTPIARPECPRGRCGRGAPGRACGHDADCLPVLFCDDDAAVVAAATRAGAAWPPGAGAHRGAHGVTPSAWRARPAIGPTAFEVGVRCARPSSARTRARPPPSSWVACRGSGSADLCAARRRLTLAGVERIDGGSGMHRGRSGAFLFLPA